MFPKAFAALGDKVVDATLAVLVARIPVLDGRVFYLGVIESDEFYYCGMQLVLVAHWRRAPFQIAHIAVGIGNDQRALELASILGVDAEVGRELHRAADALGDVTKRAIAEDSGVERSEEIVGVGNHRPEIFLDQVRVLLDRL